MKSHTSNFTPDLTLSPHITHLMRGEGSPTADRHSDLMNSATSLGNFVKCAFTLFFRISPESDLVASSWPVILVRTYMR